jgi:hypothetical protein
LLVLTEGTKKRNKETKYLASCSMHGLVVMRTRAHLKHFLLVGVEAKNRKIQNLSQHCVRLSSDLPRDHLQKK